MKLFINYKVILYVPNLYYCETHRLAHVLIDDHVSRIIDMEISN
jgi:hypothetical protein